MNVQARELGKDPQVAVGIARNLLRTQLLQRGVHLVGRSLCRVEEDHAVVFDHVSGEKRRVIGHDVRRGKRLHLCEQIQRQALRARHRVVVEEVIDDPRGGFPSHPPLHAGHALAFPVGRGDRHVVVVSGFGVPRAVHLGVEGPVGDVEALDGVDECRPPQPSRRQPLAPPPLADALAHGAGINAERQHAGGADGRLDLLIGHERRRAAELAVLPHARRIEHHHRLAALALHAVAFRLPAARLVGQFAQRPREVLFGDFPRGPIDLIRRLGATERAHELLLRRVPLGLRAAGRALVLVDREDLVQRTNPDPLDYADM